MPAANSYLACARLGATTALLSLSAAAGAMGAPQPAASGSAALGAAQIAARHIDARGGLAAWRAVQTLTISGKLEAGTGNSLERSQRFSERAQRPPNQPVHSAAELAANKDAVAREQATPQVELPFRLEMKRPHKSRLEILVAGKTAVQVFDGTSGWKLRPFLGRDDAEPFSAEEARAQSGSADLEDPLMDYAAKGTRVALEGVEPVEGHDAYRLRLNTKAGFVQHVWIDTRSFLDVKIEGIPRRVDGRLRTVWVYQRDFHPVQGLQVPYLYETVVDGSPQTHKMSIDAVVVNRPLDDGRFGKPQPLVAGAPAATAPIPASR